MKQDYFESIMENIIRKTEIQTINKIYHTPISQIKQREKLLKERNQRESRVLSQRIRPSFTSDPRYIKGQYERNSNADRYSRTGSY